MQRCLPDRQRNVASPSSAQRLMELKLQDSNDRLADAYKPQESVMTKLENRCSYCSGKLGLVCYHHWGLRFCRKACKDAFLAKTVKDYARMRRWLSFLPRGAA